MFFISTKNNIGGERMPHKNKQNKQIPSAEKKLKEFNRKSEYPVVNRASLKDYDALQVKRWVEENEL